MDKKEEEALKKMKIYRKKGTCKTITNKNIQSLATAGKIIVESDNVSECMSLDILVKCDDVSGRIADRIFDLTAAEFNNKLLANVKLSDSASNCPSK